MRNSSTAVIGAGSWGTAIALLLSSKGYHTYLWGHRPEHIVSLQKERQNSRYLPGFLFNENLYPVEDITNHLGSCRVVNMVVPSQFFRGVFRKILPHLQKGTVIVSAVKGIENDSLSTMTEVMHEEIDTFGSRADYTLAVLSGPSFAREVAEGHPTAVTVGSCDKDTAMMLQNFFGTEIFRVYTSDDVTGLEISGAFKNIIAIATGICDGLGYGMNTRAALITRGLAEISRYGVYRGADPRTFLGLSGVGDLILTSTGDLSRNRTVGIKLGNGKKLEQILEEMEMVAEGVKTSLSGYNLMKRAQVEMPILEQVYTILYENKDCAIAVKDLLSRQLRKE
ncbi:MAG: NAD(P)H-dependent glycerol-3-phosphate dehydrogenase [Desulfopila sp.]|jgi:glycerol-3-phosphate dehydrogenase (NAD(P)+)|nr:NAD(P)H-dependent glycerol-3-phosphate dehydrogenase [Desulfopila sp.]